MHAEQAGAIVEQGNSFSSSLGAVPTTNVSVGSSGFYEYT
jgi:hypothetical protein